MKLAVQRSLCPGFESSIRTLVIERPSSQYLETLGPCAQSSSDLGSRRRERIGYDGGDLEEWRGWRGVETSWSGRLTEGYNDLTAVTEGGRQRRMVVRGAS